MASGALARLFVRLDADGDAEAKVRSLGDGIGRLDGDAKKAGGGLGGMVRGLGEIGLAAGGIAALGGAVQGLAGSFTGPAMEMENARARIQAFTKDTARTEEILRAVRAEADKTPFSFGEMASAAASLGPISQKTGADLTSLLQAAESLSASDPLQGFEGAVVALREAASGDLMSLRERFEVDTRGMAAAMAAGVPAIEAVTKGLAEQGINLDMVRNLANTTTGRISTFSDTLEGLRRTAGEKILAGFNTGLVTMSDVVTANMPQLTALAGLLGEGIAAAISLTTVAFTAITPILTQVIGMLAAEAPAAGAAMADALTTVGAKVGEVSATLLGLWEQAQPVIATVTEALAPAFSLVARHIDDLVIPALVALGVVAAVQIGAVVLAAAPLTLTIGGIVVAIALLAEAWENNWGGIRDITAGAANLLGQKFDQINGAVQMVWGAMLEGERLWTGAWNAIVGTVVDLGEKAIGFITGMGPRLRTAGAALGEQMRQGFASIPIISTVANMAAEAAKYLPHSLAELGGLSVAADYTDPVMGNLPDVTEEMLHAVRLAMDGVRIEIGDTFDAVETMTEQQAVLLAEQTGDWSTFHRLVAQELAATRIEISQLDAEVAATFGAGGTITASMEEGGRALSAWTSQAAADLAALLNARSNSAGLINTILGPAAAAPGTVKVTPMSEETFPIVTAPAHPSQPGFDWGAYNAANQGKPRNPDGTVKMARGGQVWPWSQVQVGEGGIETFTPSVPGVITPNPGTIGGGGQPINLTATVVLDGEVVGRASWRYMKRRAEAGARMGV